MIHANNQSLLTDTCGKTIRDYFYDNNNRDTHLLTHSSVRLFFAYGEEDSINVEKNSNIHVHHVLRTNLNMSNKVYLTCKL